MELFSAIKIEALDYPRSQDDECGSDFYRTFKVFAELTVEQEVLDFLNSYV
ncbi:MAG: hypothetical protein GY810_12245 [Aureispira sp.]|nr:hypothetical protein [Aureispira sp.]